MSRTLDGKRVLVTGAADGIGKAITELFVEEGARVVAVDIQDERLHAAFRDNSSVYCIALDITGREAPHQLVSFTQESLGGLDILVNNAGIGGDYSHISETSDDVYARVMAVNVEAPFRISRAFVTMLSAKRCGRIINTGSICSHVAIAGLGIYTTSKHAVLGLTRAQASELGHLGITANSIEPGVTMTGLTRSVLPSPESKKGKEYLALTNALGRYGQPEDLAGAALYFASDRSGFVTGRSIAVDGGMLCALYAKPS